MLQNATDSLDVVDHHVVLGQLLGQREVPLHVDLEKGVPVEDVVEPGLGVHLGLDEAGDHKAPLRASCL